MKSAKRAVSAHKAFFGIYSLNVFFLGSIVPQVRRCSCFHIVLIRMWWTECLQLCKQMYIPMHLCDVCMYEYIYMHACVTGWIILG